LSSPRGRAGNSPTARARAWIEEELVEKLDYSIING
jgi:hypothetical protein